MKCRLLVVGALTVATFACGDPFGPNGVRHELAVGRMTFLHHSVDVAVPDSVFVGKRFDVTVRTYGGGCMRQGGTDVLVRGLQAELTPLDYFDVAYRKDVVCPAFLAFYVHTARISFDQAGIATVRIHGRGYPGDSAVVIEHAVIVRPAR